MSKIPVQGYIKKMIVTGQLPKLIIYSVAGVLVSIFLLFGLISLTGINIFGIPSPDYFVFAILSGTGIYGMYEYIHYRRVYKINYVLPDFVRDLASARRSGMTFSHAILFTSNGNYGLLTKEIKRIAQEISWGSSVEEALSSFADRIDTSSVHRTISLIIEAIRSGGNVADVLMFASNDALEIKHLNAERRVTMATYVIVIYVSMFVFMGIIAILAGVFIPSITGTDAHGLSQTMGGGFTSQNEIIQVFYFATLVQSIGTGLVAGVFEDGRFESSVKHIFVMVLISWFVFRFLVML